MDACIAVVHVNPAALGHPSELDTGVYHFPGTTLCPKASFAYTEFTQHQTATFQALPEFFDATLTLEWYLDSTPLYSGGTVALSVTSRSALPPPSGELTYGAEVLVDYKVTGAQVELSNRPVDGSYDCVLRVIAKDATGRMASDEITLTFLGEVLEFESKYYDAMTKCLAKTKGFVSRVKTKPKPFRRGCDPGLFKQKKKKIADTVREIVRRRPGMADSLDKAFGHVPGVGLHSGLPKRSSKKKKKPKAKQKPG